MGLHILKCPYTLQISSGQKFKPDILQCHKFAYKELAETTLPTSRTYLTSFCRILCSFGKYFTIAVIPLVALEEKEETGTAAEEDANLMNTMCVKNLGPGYT